MQEGESEASDLSLIYGSVSAHTCCSMSRRGGVGEIGLLSRAHWSLNTLFQWSRALIHAWGTSGPPNNITGTTSPLSPPRPESSRKAPWILSQEHSASHAAWVSWKVLGWLLVLDKCTTSINRRLEIF